MDAQRPLRLAAVPALVPALVLGLVLGLLLSACAGRQTEALLSAPPPGLPSAAEVAGVPFFPQQDKACGPASLAMALSWSGLAADPDALSTQVYSPAREGSLATDMLGAARRQGRLAVKVRGMDGLLAELAAGHPVVVFQNLGLEMKPLWHFAVAVGYDLPRRQIVLHSGLDAHSRMSLDTFEHTWERAAHWAVVVLPPDRLPAAASEAAVAEAAAGLERVGSTEAAAGSYAALLARWPSSLSGAIGLGNSLYRLGDREGAAAAFRSATRHHPGSAAAWNNLAHVLVDLERGGEAVAAAEEAVRLGGGEGAYGETLALAKARVASH